LLKTGLGPKQGRLVIETFFYSLQWASLGRKHNFI
jgi:hypothetical protein